MKIPIKIILFAMLMANCKKDDTTYELVNNAPQAFTLLTVENLAEDAVLNPTFTWQPSIDRDGDSVVYDLYLDIHSSTATVILNANPTPPDPTVIVAQGLTKTSFALTDTLPINTSFTWKVVARDNQGGSVESDIFQFSTRLLNLGEEALTQAAPFDVRKSHGSVFFKDKFWVIGGSANIEDIKNDVWSSTDGITWVQETADAGFSSRAQFGVTVFQNRIFIIGGFGNSILLEDVWSSVDGVNWKQETANTGFSPRAQTKLLNYQNKLYAIGGIDNFFDANTGSTEEVWSSADGVNWEQETNVAPYLARFGFEALVFDNKMFVIGGALATTFEFQTDVWYSTDGKNWIQVQQQENKFAKRTYFNGTVFNSKIWLAGGFFENGEENTYYADFWSSSDGISWRREVKDAGYEPRSFPTLVSNQDYMLLIGGEQTSTNTKLNEIWRFD